MPVWTFYDFVEPTGRVPFWDWFSELPEDAQAHIDIRILQMEGLQRWSEKWISAYKSKGRLFELRIPFNKVQYRPLGMYGAGHSFVLLGGATERDGSLPQSIVKAAVQRQDLLAKEPHHVRRHRFYQDTTLEEDARDRQR